MKPKEVVQLMINRTLRRLDMIDITGRRLDTVDKQNPEKVGY